MRVLIFGGTGFLGKNLVEYLMEKKYDIGMYIRPQAIHQNFIQERKTSIELYCGEFQSEGDFRSIVHGYDVVYHLISSTVPGIVNPLQDIETTIKPSLRLLEACVKESVKKIIFFSSGGTVYGVPKWYQFKKHILDSQSHLMVYRSRPWNGIFSFTNTPIISP